MKQLLFVFVFFFVVVLGFTSGRFYPETVDLQSHQEPQGYLFVWVDGEVKKPGRYLAKEGERARDVAARAEPLDPALLEGKKWEKPVRSGQRIKIGARKQKSTGA